MASAGRDMIWDVVWSGGGTARYISDRDHIHIGRHTVLVLAG